MKSRARLILGAGFGSLLLLIALAGLDTFRRASHIYGEIFSLQETYRKGGRVLSGIESDLHLSGVFVRDYLLDPSHIAGDYYRERLLAIRSSMQTQLEELSSVVAAEDAAHLHRLRAEVDSYWDSFDPLFEWSPRQKLALSSAFLRKQVLPRRDAVLAMAREVEALNDAHLKRQKQALDRSLQQFRRDLARMVAITLALGIVVAVVSILRISRLEERAGRDRARTERAENELRRLSQQLVEAQEQERKSISRELHDEVGQMLTALRVELGNLEQLCDRTGEEFHERLGETKKLSEATLRAVRDLAMGLRPSMLDDLGLAPALEWQARDFSRRFGVPVNVQLEGKLDHLPERHRTCVYRIVQEALTNCARHARASSIRLIAHGHLDRVSLTIQDDGVGFQESEVRSQGLGLMGIQERVRELGGSVTLFSQPEKGTVLTAEIPILDGSRP